LAQQHELVRWTQLVLHRCWAAAVLLLWLLARLQVLYCELLCWERQPQRCCYCCCSQSAMLQYQQQQLQ
jgi:hypothetical protein